jgi:hypothetical protein
MSGRRIDLSATQVIASMLAAVTGAVAASTLGIAGTVIGAAVMSVASTAVAAVYKHYIARSRERLRAAAESARIPPLVGGGAAAAIRRLQRVTQTAQQTDQTTTAKVPGERHVAGADADKTEVFPAVGFSQHRWHDADRANGFARHPHDGADGKAGEPDADHAAVGTAAPEEVSRSRWRRPLVLAGVALGIFLLAMGGITAFEAVAGKPLDAIVGGKPNSGTTVGSLIGGQSAHTAPRRTTPAPTPAPGASTSPTPTPTPSPTPTPTTTPTPTPTPTQSPGASTAPSTGASAGPATTQ